MFHLIFCLIVIYIRAIFGSLCITKVIVRVPKEHDIGLIFDLTVSNNIKADKKEMLEFIVSSDGTCTLNTTKGAQVRASRIFGGDFGAIEPGESVTVSLIWPTVSLYNRVGFCPITISTSNAKNDVANTKQLLYFDTRFETLDPDSHSLRKHKNFLDCKNWDQDYYKNCTPVNCEERYFGQRSFYNYQTEQCEPVAPCAAPNSYYDFYANECVDKDNFITDEELEQIKQGKFDNNYLELRPTGTVMSEKKKQMPQKTTEAPNLNKINKTQCSNGTTRGKTPGECCFSNKLSLADFNNCFQPLQDDTGSSLRNSFSPKKHEKKSAMNRFYFDWYLPLRALNQNDDDGNDGVMMSNSGSDTTSSSSIIDFFRKHHILKWIVFFMQFFFIISLIIIFQVAATIVAYILICIIINSILECVATTSVSHLTKHLTPRESDNRFDIITKASLLSQR